MTYIAAYLLGLLSFGAFMLVLLTRHRAPTPTLHRRKNRDRLPEVHNVPPMPQVKPAKKPCIGCYGGDLPCVCGNRQVARDAEVGGISYQWLGVTGSEQE